MTLLLPQGEDAEVEALQDSGATSKKYVNERVASMLTSRGIVVEASIAIICTGISDMCERCKGSIELSVLTKDEENHSLNLDYKLPL
jgi:hypothetical protein